MATEAPIIVSGTSDVADILRDQKLMRQQIQEVAEAYGVTESEARKAIRTQERQAKVAKRTADAQRRAVQQQIADQKRLRREAFDKTRTAVAAWGGSIVNDVGDVVEAINAIGPAGTVAGGALFALGGAAAGAAIGLGAIAGTVIAFQRLAFESGEALKRLDAMPEKMRPIVRLTAEQRKEIESVTATWNELAREVDALTVEVAAGGKVAAGWSAFQLTLKDTTGAARNLYAALHNKDDVEAVKAAQRDLIEGFRRVQAVIRGEDTGIEQRLADAADRAAEQAEGVKAFETAVKNLNAAGQRAVSVAREEDAARRSSAAAWRAYAAEAAAAFQRMEDEYEAGSLSNIDKEIRETIKWFSDRRADEERAAAELDKAAEARQEEAHRRALARNAEAEAALQRRRDLEMSVAQAAVDSAIQIADAAGVSGRAINIAQTIAAAGYQAAAASRAAAEGGFIAGLPMALAMIGTLAPLLAEARNARAQSDMGSFGGRQLNQGGQAPDQETVKVRRNQAILSPSDLARMQADPVIVVAVDNQMHEAASQRAARIGRLYGRRGRAA